jgi:hypothetical protein
LNDLDKNVKIVAESDDELSWELPEQQNDSVVGTAAVCSLLPTPENSLAESLFIQIWGPDLLRKDCEDSSSVSFICKCSYLMEWFVKSSKEIAQQKKPFTFRYFLETHRFHNFILSLIGLENATVLFEPIDIVDSTRQQHRCRVIESLMPMLCRPYAIGAIDSTGVCICASVVASNALLLGDIDLFFKAMKLIKTLHRSDGLLKDSIRMHDVDFSCLVFSLVLCIVSAVVGAVRLNADMTHSASAILQNVRNMISKLVITSHIGNGLMSFILSGIIQGCLKLCKSSHRMDKTHNAEAVPCCTVAAIIEVCAEAINDLISEPKDVVHFDTSVTTNAFSPGTFLSFDKISSLVETLERVGHISSIEDIRRKMIYKLNLSVEIINNFFNSPQPPLTGPIVSDDCNSKKEESTTDDGEPATELVILKEEEDDASKPYVFPSEVELDFELVASDDVSEVEAELSYLPPPFVSPFVPVVETLESVAVAEEEIEAEANEIIEAKSQRKYDLWEMEPDEVVEVQPEFFEYWLHEPVPEENTDDAREPEAAHSADEAPVETDELKDENGNGPEIAPIDTLVVSSDDDEDSQSSVMRSIALAKIMANRMEAERVQLKQKRLADIQSRIEQDKERALMEIEEKRMRDIIRSEKARRQLNLAESRIAKVREEKLREYHIRLEEYERQLMFAEETWQRENEAWMAQQLAAQKKIEEGKHRKKGTHHSEAGKKASQGGNTANYELKENKSHSENVPLDSQHAPTSAEAKPLELENKNDKPAAVIQPPVPISKSNEENAAVNKQPETSTAQSKDQKDGGCVIF